MAIVTAHVQAVQQLYVAYFNRPADTAGLDYWTNVVAAQKGSTAAVSAAFAAEAEYKTEYAGMSNADVVNKVYQNLFGRAAEDAGKKYWADLLDKKQITIDKVVAEIAKGAQTTDAEAYENKVAGATAFTAALDTTAEQNGYKGAAANTQAKAFITSITTDASLTAAIAPATLNATVAKVVAAGTPFTLEGAMANVLASQQGKTAALATLAANEAVDAELDAAGVTGTPTDAQIITAVNAAVATANAGVNAILPGFSAASAAMQSALIADKEAALATTLKSQQTTLTNAQTAIGKVANLSAAIAANEAAQATLTTATTTAALTANAQANAAANFGILSGKTLVADATTGDLKDGTKTVIDLNTAKTAYTVGSGITEADYKGVTEYVAALNANLKAQAAKTAATTAAADAAIAADILDTADANVSLKAVAAAMVFTTLATDELPTYQKIQAEDAALAARVADLDAVAGGAGQYKTALGTLATGVAAAATAADAKVLTDAAIAKGYINSGDATKILAAYNADKTTVTAALVETNSWLGRDKVFSDAVATLMTVENGDVGIGALAKAEADADLAIEGTQDQIEALAEAVAAYKNAQAVNTQVAATDSAIAAAVKVLTDKGYAAPATLNGTISLASSKSDIYTIATTGDADTDVRSFGVQGQDSLYVGTSLKYNSTKIGSDSGETALAKAGDNSALEFFLNETATGVEVIVEKKAFGSESAADADLTIITLVGVDLADITVNNGFITVGTAA